MENAHNVQLVLFSISKAFVSFLILSARPSTLTPKSAKNAIQDMLLIQLDSLASKLLPLLVIPTVEALSITSVLSAHSDFSREAMESANQLILIADSIIRNQGSAMVAMMDTN